MADAPGRWICEETVRLIERRRQVAGHVVLSDDVGMGTRRSRTGVSGARW